MHVHFPAAETERNRFMTALELQRGVPHIIDRATLYDDVLSLYSKKLDEIILDYPFMVEFQGEIAVDLGGVARDLF